MPRSPAGASRTPPGTRPRYHHGNLRRALLDAALQLVETRGTGALTLRAVARLAGVSQAAPYRHFAGKEALLAAVAEEGFRAMTAGMRRAIGPHGDDPLGRFKALGLAYIAFSTSNPSHFRVMFGREVKDRDAHPDLSAAAAETFGLLLAAVKDCQGAGFAHTGDPQELALSAWATVHGLAALWVDGQLAGRWDRGVEALAHVATGELFFGLAPREA